MSINIESEICKHIDSVVRAAGNVPNSFYYEFHLNPALVVIRYKENKKFTVIPYSATIH